MIFREALLDDIPQMQVVRNAVKENVLSNPDLISDADYRNYLIEYGKGWVCEVENRIVAFVIVDLIHHNVWALFVLPHFEGKGIGKHLQNLMLGWYFSQTTTTLWLSTAFFTRAENFYRRQGWVATGLHGSKEIRFEMTADSWQQHR